MNKKNVLWILLDLVFLIIFNAIYFVIGGTHHSISAWISYGFIHFSYIMLLITPFLIRNGTSKAVFGFSLYAISSVYFLVALVVGVVFILAHPESYKASLIVQLLIAGLYAILLLSHMISNEHTSDSIERHEVELEYVKTCSSRLDSILKEDISDRELKKQIRKAYDIIHGSQVKSNSSVRDYELSAIKLIDDLEETLAKNKMPVARRQLEELIRTAMERNRRLKYGN